MRIHPNNTKIELSVRSIKTFLSCFHDLFGAKELQKFIEETGMPLEYFEDENNWVSFDYYCNVLNALVNYSGDPNITYKFGLEAAKKTNWGMIQTILKSFTSCAYAYKMIVSLSPRWSKISTVKLIELKRNKAIIKGTLREGLIQNKNNCLGIQGQFAAIPTIWSLPPAKIKELQCAAEGADSCIYEITWQNPPAKKTGIYLFLTGIVFSLFIYQILIRHKNLYAFIPWILIILIPIIFFFIQHIINNKKILKENSKNKEKQNNTLTENLIDIEQFNSLLQERVKKRTDELLQTNSELKKKLHDLKENESELIRTQKMSNIGKVAVEISSKLKVPITEIKNSIDELSNFENDEITTDLLLSARRATDRCDKIVNDLLTFSDNGVSKYSGETDINSLIEKVMDEFSAETEGTDIKLTKNLVNGLPGIKIDPGQLQQILMILLNNAADAINHVPDKKNSEISVKTNSDKTGIEIQITDTGCGIPAGVLNKIFDPFFSTKTTTRRKGMGLTLTYNIIKKNGGKINVESTPGTGTTFIIFFPVNDNNH
ncbi:MAG: GHKL domain-containing protein [Spirochaetes bacterium]|nr:GHKL domain-containing protein [Spirochaetota bacterium]